MLGVFAAIPYPHLGPRRLGGLCPSPTRVYCRRVRDPYSARLSRAWLKEPARRGVSAPDLQSLDTLS
jgi:hypothetical protein